MVIQNETGFLVPAGNVAGLEGAIEKVIIDRSFARLVRLGTNVLKGFSRSRRMCASCARCLTQAAKTQRPAGGRRRKREIQRLTSRATTIRERN